MFKKVLTLMLALIMCLSLLACGSPEVSTDGDAQEGSTQMEENTTEAVLSENSGEDTAGDTAGDNAATLAAPVIEWWELYNPNGFNTVTAAISNPNSVPIDVDYDLVYYKNGVEVARSTELYNYSLMAGGKALLWANYDIPESTEVDDVKMENIVIAQANASPINGEYEYMGITDGTANFNFTFESKPTLATIYFVLYNDNNQNGQYDKGEIVVTNMASLTEQTGVVGFETTVYSYTDFEVFFTAN